MYVNKDQNKVSRSDEDNYENLFINDQYTNADSKCRVYKECST
jgi:hypothetical protein